MSDLTMGDRLEALAREAQAIAHAAIAERDALAAVIEAIRHNWRTQKPALFHGVTKQIIDRAPAAHVALARREGRMDLIGGQ